MPHPDRLWGPLSLSNGYQEFFLEDKRPGREADHSPSSSSRVKMSGAITPFLNTLSWRGAV
jgi:hypothetical protein